MPQSIEDVEDWKTMLGDGWQDIQHEWLHRLGNLTLVGHQNNILYSNRPFGEKKLLPSGFNETAVRLNFYIRNQETWGIVQMGERGSHLANRALEIWPYPKVDMGLVRDKDVAELRSRSLLRDVNSLTISPQVRGLLDSFQESIRKIGDHIPIIENRSISYYDSSGAFFAELLPMANYVRLLIPVTFDEVEDPDGLAGDVTAWKFLPNVVHRDCGVFVDVREPGQVESALRLVSQGFEVATE